MSLQQDDRQHEPTPWKTPAEAAKRLKSGRKQIYALIASGRLRAARISSRKLVTCDEWIDNFVASCAPREVK